MISDETKARFLGLYCMILADGVIDSQEAALQLLLKSRGYEGIEFKKSSIIP